MGSQHQATEVLERIAAARRDHKYTYEPPDADGTVNPRNLIAALESGVSHPRHISLNGGHFTTFRVGLMTWEHPTELFFGLDFGSIGQGLPFAIGVASAVKQNGERARVVALVGDGGLLMNVQELETAVRLGLTLNIIVLNDQAYGQEVHFLNMYGLDESLARITTPDLTAMAELFGAKRHACY